MNTTTKRYSRTLNEAFGPYAEGRIYPPKDPLRWKNRAASFTLVAAGIVAEIALLVALYFHNT